MPRQSHSFSFEVFDADTELTAADASLLNMARKVTADAYAPYSKFKVGAVARLANGETVSGTNQENASFPAGICAERVLLSTASSLYPNTPIESIAISYHQEKKESGHPITPCGICRQSLLEYELRMNHPIRLILAGMKGKVFIIPRADSLLPLAFTNEELS
jgi:cytidine deaminase